MKDDISLFNEVFDERRRQDAKWGEQNHPSVLPLKSPVARCLTMGVPSELSAKSFCDAAARCEELTWSHIAVEELSEVICAEGDAERRAELVQLAAVVFAWIGCIDRRAEQEAEK